MTNNVENEITIVSFEKKYAEAFKNLNQEWIENFFEMEENDQIILNSPEEYIINKGGEIIFALFNNQPVGVCALVKSKTEEYDYEIAKMAVSPKAQGKQVGYLLGKSLIEIAKKKGAKKLYLESNTKLVPAINLYKKLGFREIEIKDRSYKRVDIVMELLLN